MLFVWDAELWFGRESFLAALELIAEVSPLSRLFQDLLPLRGSLGQFNAQLAAPEQSHSIRGEDLHDPLRLPGGTVHCLLSRARPPPLRVRNTSSPCRRWKTAPNLPLSPKTSAWCFTPETQSSQPPVPSGTSLAPEA